MITPMKHILLFKFVFLLFFLVSCGNGNQQSPSKKETSPKTETNASLPGITFEEMKEIYETCDYIDFIFYNVDFSMSINAKTNIQRTVGFISTSTTALKPSCQAMGRIFFQRNGELLIEADMFFDENCQYFVFQKEGKPAYINAITPQGQAYFKQIFSQVRVSKSN